MTAVLLITKPKRVREVRVVPTQAKRHALRTVPAADYLGVSPSLLRKYRMRAAGDPGEQGPAYIKVSPSIVLYELSALDAWLESRRCATHSRSE
jgi:hypothetical protein